MLLGPIFERFVAKSPVSVMVRGTLEYALQARALDDLFRDHAEHQYTRDLLFSSVVDLLSLVVCRTHPSVRAAYRASPDEVAVSLTSVYNKLNGLETGVSAELVRHTTRQLEPVLRQLGAVLPPLVTGYRARILDGNHLAATEHRLAETRAHSAAPLPGLALVVLDPALMLVTDVFPCEDGHAQERALLGGVLDTVCERDLWVADRNFCVHDFLPGIAGKGGCFVIREHKGLAWQAAGKLRSHGGIEGARVREQRVSIRGADGLPVYLRRVLLQLEKPTRDGETEVALLSNLPADDADARTLGRVYRKRWKIEIHHPDYRPSDKLGWSRGPPCPGSVCLATTRPVASELSHQDARRHHMPAPRRPSPTPKNGIVSPCRCTRSGGISRRPSRANFTCCSANS